MTDATARSTYFAPRAAAALYGAGRRHLDLSKHRPLLDDAVVVAAEVVELEHGSDEAVLMLHLELPKDPVAAVACANRLAHIAAPDHAVRVWARERLGGAMIPAAVRRAKTTCLMTFARDAPSPGWEAAYAAWSPEEQWLWQVASVTPFARYPPHPDAVDELRRSTVRLSADWQALVLRDGTGFVGARPDLGDADPFFGSAERYFRSVYLDALVLGEVQRMLLMRLADDLAALEDPIEHPDRLAILERRLSRFRNIFWWQQVTSHGPANDLLVLFQAQHRLPALVDQVVAELADYARQTQTAAALRSNALLAVITILGLPLGIAVALAQMVNQHRWLVLSVAVAVALLVAAAVFATGTGRELIGPLNLRKRTS
jgi:hypothetical protein